MEEGEIFLEQYNGETVDELIQLHTTHRIDSIVLAFESALDARKEQGEQLTEVELTVLAVEAFEREVNNGGFSQFFYNSSVEYAPIIVNSLKAIGCDEIARLSQKSIDLLGVDSLDPDTIEERMDPDDDALEEALGDLDDIFYDSEEVPTYALFDYIKNNIENIQLRAKN
ncbi:MAG: DMP19 family protein [Arenicella sp.]